MCDFKIIWCNRKFAKSNPTLTVAHVYSQDSSQFYKQEKNIKLNIFNYMCYHMCNRNVQSLHLFNLIFIFGIYIKDTDTNFNNKVFIFSDFPQKIRGKFIVIFL